MSSEDVVKELVSKRERYTDIREFSSRPGIYAVFCNLSEIPNLPYLLRDTDIIYIGKTESSQESRDADTHFADGMTGSSTLRRSLGALLRETLDLRPIPRNASPNVKKKQSYFKFDPESETRLTRWMQENLSLSFHEFDGSAAQLEEFETGIIKTVVPLLNIAKNTNGPFVPTLRRIRAHTAAIAHANIDAQIPPATSRPRRPTATIAEGRADSGKYRDLWSRVVGQLVPSLTAGSKEIVRQLDHEEFERVGRRKRYAFNLELRNGAIANNVNGSAVARDLNYSLQHSDRAMSVVRQGHWKFRLDVNFQLTVMKIA